MAVAFKDIASTNTGGSTATSLAISPPGTATTGDFLYIFLVYTGGVGVTVTPASGFVLAQSTNETNYSVRVYRKTYLSTDTVPYVFSLSSAQYISAVAATYTGVTLLGGGPTFVDLSGNFSDSTGTATNTTTTVPGTDGAFGIKLTVSYNTTGVITTTSPGAGLTTRADTSTSAGGFLALSVADGITANAMLNTLFPASTLSASATQNTQISFFVRPLQLTAQMPQYDSAGRSGLTAVTSGSITISPSTYNEHAYVSFSIRGAAGTVTSVTSSLVVWKQLAAIQNPSNTIRTEVWVSTIPLQGAFNVVNFTFSGTVDSLVSFGSFPFSAPIANVTTAAADTGTPSASLVTQTDNCLVIAVSSYTANVSTTPTAPNILVLNNNYGSPAVATGTMRQRVTTKGTTATSNASAPTVTPWAMVQFEVPTYSSGSNFLPFCVY
jgi:hypothetical protein